MALITMEEIEGLSPVFRGRCGHIFANMLVRLLGIDKLSEIYSHYEHLSGPDFIEHYLKHLDINYKVAGMENLASLKTQPFITVSNHPYGALDGLMIIDLIGHFREDYKVIVNGFLSLVKTMRCNFIGVKPDFKTAKVNADSVNGIREALAHLKDGHPLGLFPSGAVSDLSLRERCIRDRQWQKSAIAMIKKAKVPVVPVRFFERNSDFYYGLGLINSNLRVLRLPREILNKGKKLIRVGVGEPISVERQAEFDTIESYGAFLRNSVYDMTLPENFIQRSNISFDI